MAKCEFSVADNGIGIAPRYAEQVFDFGQRLHSDDAIPGSGIGLTVCKTVVERHGGRIWVEPSGTGGSRFRFTLPDVLTVTPAGSDPRTRRARPAAP